MFNNKQIRKINIIIICTVLFFGGASKILCQCETNFFFSPHKLSNWETRFQTGLSITRIPTEIVEEEVNTSPMLIFDFRLGMPANFSFFLRFNTNYMASNGTLALQWTAINSDFALALGFKGGSWFGHLEMDAIQLKSNGSVYSPYISMGYNFKDFILSMNIETQHSFMLTWSKDASLGKIQTPDAGIGVSMVLEQALWNNHWVNLCFKVNYAKFYYQSWLSFSTLNEYLLYPEFSFGFNL